MTGTGHARHGGRLAEARAAWPDAPRPWLDLSTGINPRPWRSVRAGFADLSRLPDPVETAALEAAAARAFGAHPACVAAVAGAEAGLRLLPALTGARRVAIASPTYASHADAWRLAGVEVTTISGGDWAHADADVLVVVNPNNPCGAAHSPDALLKSAAGRWLLVDESFVEVAPELSLASRAAGRVVALRSFGKFYGLAGVRLGFVVADPTVAAEVRRRTGDWPVGADAIALGRAAYADGGWADRTRRRLARDSARLDGLLTRAGLDVVGGTALFRLARTAGAARRFERLAALGVLIRPFDHDPTLLRFGLPGAGDWRRLEIALETSR